MAQRMGAASDQERFDEAKRSVEARIAQINEKLATAKSDAKRAQAEVDALVFSAAPAERSALEELAEVRQMLPDTAPPLRSGLYPSLHLHDALCPLPRY